MSRCLVQIDRLNQRGRGVGAERMEVVGGLPGDIAWVVPISRKRRARLEQIETPSEDREPLRCVHAPSCGGCSIQAMNYQVQLQVKEKMVRDLFAPFPVLSIEPCEEPWGYRNKMEFSFSEDRSGQRFLGLILADSKGRVVDLSECHLVAPWFMDMLKSVRLWWSESGLQAYRMNNTGSLRTLTLREGVHTGDKMVILTVSGAPEYALTQVQLERFKHAVKQALPDEERLSIFLRIHQIQKGQPTQFYEIHLSGPDHLTEALHLDRRMLFKISPTSFFQPNTRQAEKWYRAIQEWGRGAKLVYDLYAGTATLGLALARFAEKVVSIELNPYAVFDARVNQELNGIENIEIIQGDVGAVLSCCTEYPDLVVVDPPRAGLDLTALAHLTRLKPARIIYVSCHPKTQRENVQALLEAGYVVERIWPIDQFPHTIHVENIVLLRHAGSSVDN